MLSATGRVYGHFWLRYRATWRTTVLASFIEPLVYLGALGVGLGAFVDAQGSSDALGGVQYLWFLAPGLQAALAYQVAATEASWPVLAGFRWDRTYHGMYTTPLGRLEIALGQLTWIAVRLAIAVGSFSVAMVLFGTWRSWWAPLSVLTSVLGGVAFGAALAAYAAGRDREDAFAAINRFVVMPMFLFSGTFFPVDQLPEAVQPVARVTPMYHSVELSRGLALGTMGLWDGLGHLLYLVVLASAAIAMAARTFGRRLQR